MHDIWNPWHGCVRCSEGCQNCYMYYLDALRGHDTSEIYRTKAGFEYPIRRGRDGNYKIKSGELIRVCMASDFFLQEADRWRPRAWEVIRQRPDVKFFLLTKRPQRVRECLPDNWGSGWENVIFNVTCENQRRADERIPILVELPFRHKGIMCAPFIGEVSIERWLTDYPGIIEQVVCGGENYGGAHPCHFDWVRRLRRECEAAGVTFCFIETGTVFVKDGKTYRLNSKRLQSEMAFKSGMYFSGKPVEWKLTDALGMAVPQSELYVPRYKKHCMTCGSRPICNGCADCGQCRDDWV